MNEPSTIKQLLRALKFFRPDALRVLAVLALMLTSIGLNVLKPWPTALIVDCLLGSRPMPAWARDWFGDWLPAAQLAGLIGVLLAVHLCHAMVSAAQNYMAIGVGLRGLQRVRNEVFGWLQRLSLRFHHGTEAGDVIFRAGMDTCVFPTLLQ